MTESPKKPTHKPTDEKYDEALLEFARISSLPIADGPKIDQLNRLMRGFLGRMKQ